MMFNNIAERVIDIDDYTISGTSKNFKLNDKVVAFYNGTKWLVIKLTDMYSYPVVYYEYISQTIKNKKYINSLVVCPITLRSMIFKGRVVIDKVTDYTIHIIHAESGFAFDIDNPFLPDGSTFILRKPIKLCNLIDLYRLVQDPLYITPITQLPPIIPISYIENRNGVYTDNIIVTKYHPKTVVYVLRYFSQKKNAYKYSILIGKNATMRKITGYSYAESKLYNYLINYRAVLENKKAFIFPIYWYTVIILYPKAKYVYL